VGDGVELFVDANGAYDRKQAARLCRVFEDLGVTWFEEPVTSDDLESLAVLRDLTPIDITAGEYGYLLQYFAEMLRAVDVIQPDASRCSLSEWLRVAALAAASSREVSAHCAPSLHAHPACAAPNTRHIEYFADHAYVDPLLFDGVLTPADGRLWPALDRPGFGLELRHDAEQYRVK
ncbi:MAG TPA: enolase C-terminal domain-like protein, partial [Acidimicrobiales bacterium]|nr:enolase C-terminal domain-like protein [Acidimicrobiales bacterium]